MDTVTKIDLLFEKDIVPIFAENNAYVEMIQDIRERYKELGTTFPIVYLRICRKITDTS